jgi:hypothetical protein
MLFMTVDPFWLRAPDAVQHEVVHRWSEAVTTAELAATPALQLRCVSCCAARADDVIE